MFPRIDSLFLYYGIKEKKKTHWKECLNIFLEDATKKFIHLCIRLYRFLVRNFTLQH